MHAPAAPETAAASDVPAFKEFDRPDHPIDDIVPSPFQNRERLDEAKLQELAHSIREMGLLQPLVLRIVKGNTYELVAGERRWRAAKLAGLKTVRVRVLPLTDLQAAKAVIIENDQREDVSALERARGYARLMELDPAYRDRQKLASEVGKSLSWVHNAMKLLEASEPVQNALLKGSISEWHAIAIARLSPADQLRALRECTLREYHNVPGGSTMSVRALKEWIAQNVYMDLAKAPFDSEDAALRPSAGVCSQCPKRAGANAALLEAKHANTCTDRSCYEAKTRAHAAKRVDALSIAGMKAVRVVRTFYLHDTDRKALGGGDILTGDQWRDAGKKICPHARAAVLLDTETGAVKEELSVCTKPSACSVHTARHEREHFTPAKPSAADKAAAERQKAKERKRREDAERRRELLAGVRDAVTELREADLRIVAAQFFSEMHADRRKVVYGLMDWPAPPKPTTGSFPDFVKAAEKQLAQASAATCSQFLVVCALSSTVTPATDYFTPDGKPLDEAAKRWKVDAAALAKKRAAPGPSKLTVGADDFAKFEKAYSAQDVSEGGPVKGVLFGGLLYTSMGAVYREDHTKTVQAHRLYRRADWPFPKTKPLKYGAHNRERESQKRDSYFGMLVRHADEDYVLGASVDVSLAVETSPRKPVAKKKR